MDQSLCCTCVCIWVVFTKWKHGFHLPCSFLSLTVWCYWETSLRLEGPQVFLMTEASIADAILLAGMCPCRMSSSLQFSLTLQTHERSWMLQKSTRRGLSAEPNGRLGFLALSKNMLGNKWKYMPIRLFVHIRSKVGADIFWISAWACLDGFLPVGFISKSQCWEMPKSSSHRAPCLTQVILLWRSCTINFTRTNAARRWEMTLKHRSSPYTSFQQHHKVGQDHK